MQNRFLKLKNNNKKIQPLDEEHGHTNDLVPELIPSTQYFQPHLACSTKLGALQYGADIHELAEAK